MQGWLAVGLAFALPSSPELLQPQLGATGSGFSDGVMGHDPVTQAPPTGDSANGSSDAPADSGGHAAQNGGAQASAQGAADIDCTSVCDNEHCPVGWVTHVTACKCVCKMDTSATKESDSSKSPDPSQARHAKHGAAAGDNGAGKGSAAKGQAGTRDNPLLNEPKPHSPTDSQFPVDPAIPSRMQPGGHGWKVGNNVIPQVAGQGHDKGHHDAHEHDRAHGHGGAQAHGGAHARGHTNGPKMRQDL